MKNKILCLTLSMILTVSLLIPTSADTTSIHISLSDRRLAFSLIQQTASSYFQLNINEFKPYIKESPIQVFPLFYVAIETKTAPEIIWEKRKGKGWGKIAKEMGLPPNFHGKYMSAKNKNKKSPATSTDDEIFDIVEPKHMAMTLMPPKETHQRSASTLSQISFFSSKSDESKTQQQAGGATSPASTKTWGSFLWRKPGTPSSPTSPPSVRDEGLYPGRLRANTVSTNHSVHTLEPIMSNGSEDALDTDSSPSAKSASSIPPPAAPAPRSGPWGGTCALRPR